MTETCYTERKIRNEPNVVYLFEGTLVRAIEVKDAPSEFSVWVDGWVFLGNSRNGIFRMKDSSVAIHPYHTIKAYSQLSEHLSDEEKRDCLNFLNVRSVALRFEVIDPDNPIRDLDVILHEYESISTRCDDVSKKYVQPV